MIISFKCKETQALFETGKSRKFNSFAKTALRKLDVSISLDDLKIPPGNRLEALQGNRLGQYSIRINDQFRICFEWQNNKVINAEIVDYH